MADYAQTASIWAGQQVNRIEIFDDIDVSLLADFFDEGFGDAPTGGVPEGVGYAGVRVAAFAGDVDFAVHAVEFGAPVGQLANQAGAFPDDPLDDGFITDAAAGAEGVFDMRLEAVFNGQYRGDTTLGIPGVAVGQSPFTDQRYITLFCGFQRRPQSRNPGPDHQAIRK